MQFGEFNHNCLYYSQIKKNLILSWPSINICIFKSITCYVYYKFSVAPLTIFFQLVWWVSDACFYFWNNKSLFMRFLYSTGWKSKSWTTVGVELKMQACWEKAMSVAELLRCVFLSSHSVSVCVCVCVYWVSREGRAAPGYSNETKLCSEFFSVWFIILVILNTVMA